MIGLRPRHFVLVRSLVPFAMLAVSIGSHSLLQAGEPPPVTPPAAEQAAPRTVQGRVVFMAEAMRRLHGIETQMEAAENILALETTAGELIPLVEDIRGRAFRRDERLRKIDVELLVRDVPQSPMIQLIRVHQLDRAAHKKFELDYWCEICAIAMYELKQCDCCQGPIELRLREIPSDDERR